MRRQETEDLTRRFWDAVGPFVLLVQHPGVQVALLVIAVYACASALGMGLASYKIASTTTDGLHMVILACAAGLTGWLIRGTDEDDGSGWW